MRIKTTSRGIAPSCPTPRTCPAVSAGIPAESNEARSPEDGARYELPKNLDDLCDDTDRPLVVRRKLNRIEGRIVGLQHNLDVAP